MNNGLFSLSFYGVWRHTIEVAVQEVQQLERRWFSDPALGGRLEQIAKKHDWEVARLQTDGFAAEGREEDVEGPDEWGETRRGKRSRLFVTIPFTGEAENPENITFQCRAASRTSGHHRVRRGDVRGSR